MRRWFLLALTVLLWPITLLWRELLGGVSSLEQIVATCLSAPLLLVVSVVAYTLGSLLPLWDVHNRFAGTRVVKVSEFSRQLKNE